MSNASISSVIHLHRYFGNLANVSQGLAVVEPPTRKQIQIVYSALPSADSLDLSVIRTMCMHAGIEDTALSKVMRTIGKARCSRISCLELFLRHSIPVFRLFICKLATTVKNWGVIVVLYTCCSICCRLKS